MTHRLIPFIGALAAAAFVAMPAASLAQSQSTSYTATFTESGIDASRVPYHGTLQLTISNDGLVHGWYRPEYNGSFILVTGSLQNGKLWLNIGEKGQLQVNAEVQRDGSLVGSAVDDDGAAIRGGAPTFYDFVASPNAA